MKSGDSAMASTRGSMKTIRLMAERVVEWATRDVLRRRWFVVLGDTLLIALAFVLAYLLRFNFDIPFGYRDRMFLLLPFVCGIRLLVFDSFGLYLGVFRYIGIRDLARIIAASTLGSLILIVGVVLTFRFEGFPRAVFFIDWFLLVNMVGLTRLSMRLGQEMLPTTGGHRVLIVGAGDSGEAILRESRKNPALGYRIVGFIDDDPQKWGLTIHGLPILGGLEYLGRIVSEQSVDEIILAMPDPTGRKIREVIRRCRAASVRFRTVPILSELIENPSSAGNIRAVEVEDLIGREPVELDSESIAESIAGKRVLVTGAGGSIGSELARQLAAVGPEHLVLLDRAESPLYETFRTISWQNPEAKVELALVDLRDTDRVRRLLEKTGCQAIFHAAAFKHVPMLEYFPGEGIDNNLRATIDLARAAEDARVATFVMISTDKVVEPSNVMGLTKHLAERYLHAFDQSARMRLITVRFGNVLESAGSVIPLFREQIDAGGPVTVTHRDVTRFFMTIREAVQLILVVASMGAGRGIYVLDMGEPIRIVELAKNLISLSGLRPGDDIPVIFTGLRPGEKLHEKLFHDHERAVPTEHPKILGVRVSMRDDAQSTRRRIEHLVELNAQGDTQAALRLMRDLVPEYTPSGTLSETIGL